MKEIPYKATQKSSSFTGCFCKSVCFVTVKPGRAISVTLLFYEETLFQNMHFFSLFIVAFFHWGHGCPPQAICPPLKDFRLLTF